MKTAHQQLSRSLFDWLSFKCLISEMLTIHRIAYKPFRGTIKADQYFIYEYLPNLPIQSALHEKKGS